MTDVPVFSIVRTFDTDIETMFDAWAVKEQMAAWSGAPGSTQTPLSGEIAVGSEMHTRSDHPQMGTMYTLAKWVRVDRPSHLAWEQSFADEYGNKTLPGFFPAWPMTLLTEVDFNEKEDGTTVHLRWTPIEYDEAGLAEFEKQMGSMRGGWGGSFDQLAEFLSAA